MHNKYDSDEEDGGMGDYGHGQGCGCRHAGHGMGMGMMGGGMGMFGWGAEEKKEFKLAILKKKERMLQAKLEFLRDMMKMVEKMPSEGETVKYSV